MKVVERIFEYRIWQQIDTDNMQFGFMKGQGTTDANFIVRQMQEHLTTVFAPAYTEMTAILAILQLPAYALPILSLLSEPYQKLFSNPQSQKRVCFL